MDKSGQNKENLAVIPPFPIATAASNQYWKQPRKFHDIVRARQKVLHVVLRVQRASRDRLGWVAGWANNKTRRDAGLLNAKPVGESPFNGRTNAGFYYGGERGF